MRVLLLAAPYADYTYPYHSLSYLVPGLEGAGYCVDVLDLNATWFRSLFNREFLDSLESPLLDELASLSGRHELDLAGQGRLVELVQALALREQIRPEAAVEVLRGDAFYDYGAYSQARESVTRFERLLNIVYGTFDFASAFARPPFNANARATVAAAERCQRFIADVERLLSQRFGRHEYLFCGVSVPFEVQLVLGLATQIAVGRVFPRARRVMGGTAITDVAKNALNPSSLAAFSACCDDFLIGECDRAIVEYAEHCADDTRPAPDRMIRLARAGSILARGYRHLALRPQHITPSYSWIDWSLYLSPERHVNYSPARGCFWNQCTFCDYGLNSDRPAAPYRKTRPADVAADLDGLARDGVRSVYLAVDALDPVFLRQFAEELLRGGSQSSWATELFLNEKIDQSLVSLLERAGLVTASFGLESGSDRVLEAMGKGQDRNRRVHGPVFAAFRSSRIGLQPKYFFGFPSEGPADREATLQLLEEYADVFSVLTRGNVFDLTAGSIVAKQPGAFGIRNVRRRPDDDIGGGLDYELDDPAGALTPDELALTNQRIRYPSAFERPWAGGIDTLHSKLYLQRHGKGVFHRLARWLDEGRLAEPWRETYVTSGFDLGLAFENVTLAAATASSCARDKVAAALGREALESALRELERPLRRHHEAREYAVRTR